MKKYVKASAEKDEALDNAISDLESDFDYIIEGLEKLSRDGQGKEALTIALDIGTELSSVISRVTSSIGK